MNDNTLSASDSMSDRLPGRESTPDVCSDYDIIIIGSGAAGLNAAVRLFRFGIPKEKIAVITEGINLGTSLNAGSDKQTYYKLSLAGADSDSVSQMASDFFSGGCVDGDHALCEAAMSARCFSFLCELGVPFPTNEFGEYVGYKTDHDKHARATSAGPLTSRYMAQCLMKEVSRIGIAVLENLFVFRYIKDGSDRICGLIAYDTKIGDMSENDAIKKRIHVFKCRYIIVATGGPGDIYADSVYPIGQSGGQSALFEIGVKGKNLTEWQFGISSLTPRWNLSGTYMQAMPRVFSVDEQGNEYEFLNDVYSTREDCLNAIFLKGYQWPFDCAKTETATGSSRIDMAVYEQKNVYNRRVFLDYVNNPCGYAELPFEGLIPEVRDYLARNSALLKTPFDRLQKMNRPAVDFFAKNGCDLSRQPVEIGVSAQHCNGGLDVDVNWQTCVNGLFACGEAAGTHGITRPGGAALNAGQVGSLRASMYIASRYKNQDREESDFGNWAIPAYNECADFLCCHNDCDGFTASDEIVNARRDMSRVASIYRNRESVERTLADIRGKLERIFLYRGKPLDRIRLRDILLTQFVYLSAMDDYIGVGGKSRGSCIIEKGNVSEVQNAPSDTGACGSQRVVQIVSLNLRKSMPDVTTEWRTVRPIPDTDKPFEVIWKQYRDKQNGQITTE